MSTDTLSTLFALLTLMCAAAVAVTWLVFAGARFAPADSAWGTLRAALSDLSLWFALIVALAATAGSLYYSIGANYPPCELCWYQRICLYPLGAILLIGAARRDRAVAWYALPPAAIGMVIAAYHTQLQAFPEQKTFCDRTNPCTNRFVWEFGFISLPLMNLVALAFITTMVVAWTTSSRRPEEVESE